LRQLDAAEAVQGSAAIVVQPAVFADKVSPTPTRDLILAIALGMLLGVGLAFLVDRLDTRIRSSEEVESLLGFPVLGEIPEPPDLPESAQSRVAMLDFPYGPFAEAIRKLRVNVEFANLDARARVIMVTSAEGGEGKTTVASNLGVALARAGRSVAICDLDARAPSLHVAFGVYDQRGLVDVAFGNCSLQDALIPVKWSIAERAPRTRRIGSAGNSDRGDLEGSVGEVRILTLGRRRPPAPADFIGSTSVRQIVSELAQLHEFVILDTPPLLPVSDSLTISEYSDAAIVVCGLKTARRPNLRRLRRMFSTFQAHVVGLVVTGTAPQGGYGPYFVGGPEEQPATPATLR
jgi:Mrp family chromosome partitioning ATPase